jgi:hypothetical protein
MGPTARSSDSALNQDNAREIRSALLRVQGRGR